MSKQRLFVEDIKAIISNVDPIQILVSIDELIERYCKSNNNLKLKTKIENLRTTFEDLKRIVDNVEHVPDDIKIACDSNETIDIETTFNYSEEVYNKLAAKVVELCDLLDNADDDDATFHISSGMIDNVGLSLIRRIIYICNESAIDRIIGDSGMLPYPYINSDSKLINVLKDTFLLIYSNPCRKFFIPMYVHLVLRLVIDVFNLPYTIAIPLSFNRRYPLNGITDDSVNSNSLRNGIINFFRNNELKRD